MSTLPTEVDYLGMSDEDLAQLPDPTPAVVVETPPDPGVVPPAPDPVDPPAPDPDDATPPVVTDPNDAGAAGGDTGKGDEGGDAAPIPDGQTPPAIDSDKPPVGGEPLVPAPVVQDQTAMAADLAARMAKGIRANGKLLQIRSAEEGEKLLQMGANFTQKMQQLQPAMRVVKMLQNNDLLDESKIAFLIDLSQKNPDAIQKLLADSAFDPLTADKAKADGYVPGDHQVSDTEVQFQQALDDLAEADAGPEFLQEIAGKWDKESKQALWKEPSLLGTLHHQRSSGIYQVITSEIERLSALGQIPVGTPFLQAYRGVGDMLNEQGRFGQKSEPAGPAATPTAAPAAPVVRGPSEAAKAAAPIKATTPKSAAPTTDFLGQSDEEFLKSMKGRV